MDALGEINALVADIWGSVLGMLAVPADASVVVGGPRLTGVVHIQGDWEGTVTVDCPLPLARRAAAAMFAMPGEDLTKPEIEDALGEITNMTGGGIKSLCEGSCRLSLPTVIEGTGFTLNVPGTAPVSEPAFVVAGTWLAVRVLERLDAFAGTAAADHGVRAGFASRPVTGVPSC